MALRYDRRRRMLADDTNSSAANEADAQRRAPSSASRPAQAFSEAAHHALVRPFSSLFPTRWTTIAILGAGALGAVGGILGANLAVNVSESAWATRLAPLFDLSVAGNISGWMAATLLALAAVTALYTYSLRRHRVDDYHGRYRVWLAVAAGCTLVSIGEVSNLSMVVAAGVTQAAAAGNLREELFWPTFAGLILGAISLRLFIEMRRSRAALCGLALTTAALLATAATRHAWWPIVPAEHALVVLRGTWLAGYLLLLFTFLIYARYVRLEIEGKVAARAAKAKKTKTRRQSKTMVEKSAEPANSRTRKQVRTDLDTVSFREMATPETDGDDTETASNGLSRKERRRLRRQSQLHDRAA